MVFATAEDFRLAARTIGRGCFDWRSFRAKFGCTAEVCALAWNLLDLGGAVVGGTFKHFLWGCLLLKTHGKDYTNSSVAGVSRPTFRKWAWIYIFAIGGLRFQVVSVG